ncbi:hypothetical protein ACS0TY_007146 [Phlomoides rotata]
MAASSTIVIKVKYGDMLRRFNSPVVDDKLVLNIDELRKKILSLFNFAPDTELMLTYLDEDDDVVALVDDDDLRDVVKQDLDPLRITVKLNDEKTGSQNNNLTASSTPLRSPRVEPPLPNLNAGISELLSKVPGPFNETLVKLSQELASKVAATEFMDLLLKVSLPNSGKPSESQSEVKNGTNAGAAESSTSATETKNSDCVRKPVPEATMGEKNEVKSQKATGQSTKASSFDFNAVAAALDSQNDTTKLAHQRPDFGAFTQLLRKKEKAKKLMASAVDKTLAGKGVVKRNEPKLGTNSGSFRVSDPATGDHVNVHPQWGGKSPAQIWGPPLGAPNYFGPIEPFGCPFSGTATRGNSAAPPHSAFDPVLSGGPCTLNDANGNVLHRGVRCDGCGVHPIIGPRFKSKVKVDYDLCNICFEDIGNTNDYIRMDRPAVFPPMPMYLKGLHDIRARHHHQHALRGPNRKVGAKLDSRFIQDINIFDGTVMAPSTPFTKIWRMRNNGTLVWPQKTQLVWIGGDKLSNALSIEVQIPAAGLLIEQELDVAVDFISPELPGRYISYWRMASPSGQKFGQRVWVLIQVDASMKKEMPREAVRNLNLNLPPVGSSLTGTEIITVEPEPMVEDCQPVVVDNSEKAVEFGKPDADQELKFPINDSLLVGNGASTSACAPVSYPIIDLSDASYLIPVRTYTPPPPPPPPPPSLPSAPVGQSAVEDEAENEVEEKLLRELEEMGFKQIDLNKEVLRLNKYDLEQAVDDLCEWDPILDELQEMGFNDEEMNKKLLKKNKGSIKRVVMDLIAGEKL